MSLRLLIREYPVRRLALVTETHALVLRHNASAATQEPGYPGSSTLSVPRCIVEFSNHIDLSDYRVLRASGIFGTLGLINIGEDLFLCLISNAIRVATVRPDETVQKILSVEFFCLNSSYYDFDDTKDFYSDDVSHANEPQHAFHAEEAPFEHPCQELKRMLSGGTFYYSVDFDLTNRLQDRLSEESAFDTDSLDDEFLWNQYMIEPLVRFRSRLAEHDKEALDASRILTSAIRGFVGTITVPPSTIRSQNKTNLPAALTVISRLSCRRAGTRFHSRGIDDDGNVANFVETETVLWRPPTFCFSYAQVRGSVPLFWEQASGLLPGQQKLQIIRSAEATQPAFDKHFERLEADYGVVSIINLLSSSRPGEADLISRYKYHVRQSPLNQILQMGTPPENRLLDVQFDYHAEARSGGSQVAIAVKRMAQRTADSFAYFSCVDTSVNKQKLRARSTATVTLQQEGVFRTNCLDCLDRTNLVQTILSEIALELFFQHQEESVLSDFWMKHSTLWADNGDALSKIYAGTGALKSSYTRHGKMSLAGALADVRKSATRLYVNNFIDKGKQNTIDLLLGRLMAQSPVQIYDPITDYVSSELKLRASEYSSSESIYIWVGTFNLNGKSAGMQQDLSPWLCPRGSNVAGGPEIVIAGFQEIVELSPQQIMSTDPVRRQGWEQAVKKTLNQNVEDEYVLLRTGQLVGAALLVFVKSSVLTHIKNVEGSEKKTGLSGIAGNKGAVAIRMDYANTRLCFVTAHMAAGFANYEERNRDYQTISRGLRFQRNRLIEDHDAVIWAGDFNYRIGLGDSKVRRLIDLGDFNALYQNDQLNLQMIAGQTFPYYAESRITFKPTYKYNDGTDDYDTSEKARIPAWCDRIVRKGDILKQINYATAPLRFSDHRPVYSTFQCTISVIDEAKKESLSRDMYVRRRSDIGDTTANAAGDEYDEEWLGYKAIAPELPPASSDRRKWWLDGGLPARSSIRAPGDQAMLNRARSNNPFTQSQEPDWLLDLSKISGPTHTNEVTRKVSASRVSNERLRTLPTLRDDVHDNESPVSSNIARKPAPPIPKKPDAFARSAERPKSPSSRARTMTATHPAVQQRKVSHSSPASTDEKDFPPSNTSTSLGTLSASASNADDIGPQLPPRRTASSSRKTGLMDDDADEHKAEAIPALQPQHRHH